jgi:drug/metabolite transporter (DMT)-like permease
VGEAAALGWAALFSLNSIFMRWGGIKVDVIWLNAFRTLIAAVLMLVVLLVLPGPAGVLGLPQQTVVWLVASTILTVPIGDSLFFMSCQHIGVARGLPIANAYPLVSVLLAVAFLGEVANWRLALGTILILSGAYLVARPRGGETKANLLLAARSRRTGVLLAVGASLAWGVGVIADKVAMQAPSIDLVGAAFLRLACAAIFLFIFARRQPFRGAWLNLAPGFYVGLLAAAGICGVGAPLAWLFAIQNAGAARAGLLAATGPLWGLLLSAVLLREPVTRATAAGAALTVAGVWAIL